MLKFKSSRLDSHFLQHFKDVTSIPGIPMGHIVLLRGHSDTGKTTALLEAAVSAQKRKILTCFYYY